MKKCLIPVLFMSLIPSVTHAVVAGGMVSYGHHFSTAGNHLEYEYNILDDGDSNSNYYWATQFWFKNGNGGYAGLQRGSGKRINFSIWDVTEWDNNSAAYCRSFDHEGDGVQCSYQYDWVEGENYKFDLAKEGRSVSLSVIATSTGVVTEVATIFVPESWGNIKNNINTFVEEYSQGAGQLPSCNAMANTSSKIESVKMDGRAAIFATTKQYGNCGSYAESLCTNDGTCYSKTGEDYVKFDSTEMKLINKSTGYCVDNLAGSGVIGFWACDGNQNSNQNFTYDKGSSLLKLSDYGHAKCITLADDGFIKTTSCAKSSQWWYEPVHQHLIEADKNVCIGPTELQAGYRLKEQACLPNDDQSFRFEKK